MRFVLVVITTLLCSATAWGNCVLIDISTWTPAQKQRAVVTAMLTAQHSERVTAEWASRQQIGSVVNFCAPTANLSTLTSAALQTQVQAFLNAQAATETALATERAEIMTELNTNLLCKTATLTDLITRINAERDAITTTITASTTLPLARDALTNMNNRYSAAFKQIARCMVGFMRLQQ